MRETWRRFDAWLTERLGEAPFVPSSADAKGPLAPLHRLADGQAVDVAVFEGGHKVLSSSEAGDEKAMMDALAQDEGWASAWWDPAWFPFASDGTGQLLVVHRETGEVLEFIHDDDARPVLGASLEAFVASHLDRLERGDLVFDLRLGPRDPHLDAEAKQRADARAAQEAKYAARGKWYPLFALAALIPLALLIFAFERCRGAS